MINVGKIRAGARAVYKRAASPATFLTLSWAALASTDELLAAWEACPGTVKLRTMDFKKSATAYRERLQAERDSARALVDHISTGNEDWQAAVSKGSSYAAALDRFFNGEHADSGGWAALANQLERFGCPPPPGPWEEAAASANRGLRWMSALMIPWSTTSAAAIEYTVRRGAEAVNEGAAATLETMGKDAKEAVETYFENLMQYLYAGTTGLLTLVAVGAGIWFGWPFLAPMLGLAAKKTGEG